MNWRRLVGRAVGSYFVVYGIIILYVFSISVGRIFFEGVGGFLPTFHVGSAGYGFSVGQLPFLIQFVLLIPAGIWMAWKLRRWAAFIGILGTLVLPVTSFGLSMLVTASGGPPITELVVFGEILIGLGLFIGLPTLGIALVRRELH